MHQSSRSQESKLRLPLGRRERVMNRSRRSGASGLLPVFFFLTWVSGCSVHLWRPTEVIIFLFSLLFYIYSSIKKIVIAELSGMIQDYAACPSLTLLAYISFHCSPDVSQFLIVSYWLWSPEWQTSLGIVGLRCLHSSPLSSLFSFLKLCPALP